MILNPSHGKQNFFFYIHLMQRQKKCCFLKLWLKNIYAFINVGNLEGQVRRFNDRKWTVEDSNPFVYDTWHHVALTWKAEDGLIVYLNGKEYLWAIKTYKTVKRWNALDDPWVGPSFLSTLRVKCSQVINPRGHQVLDRSEKNVGEHPKNVGVKCTQVINPMGHQVHFIFLPSYIFLAI